MPKKAAKRHLSEQGRENIRKAQIKRWKAYRKAQGGK